MIFSKQYDQQPLQQILPILSPNKFAHCIGIHRDKIEKLANKVTSFYSPFPKKTGEKERIIDNPTGLLKEVQQRINDRILNSILFPDFVIGGVKGRKPYEHPLRHVKRPIVITLDVKDCFPSITNKQIFDVWHKQLNCSSEVARLATKLTTRNGHLPLGAPTSNCLSNLALQPCLNNVIKIAEDFGFSANSVGQYIDDLAFSGVTLPGNFITSVVKEFSRHGFRIKRSKIKVMRANKPQVVTKKNVNRKVGVPRSERDKVRAALHELKNTEPQSLIYVKRYRSVKGRIKNIDDFHPGLAKKMNADFNRLPNPDKRK